MTRSAMVSLNNKGYYNIREVRNNGICALIKKGSSVELHTNINDSGTTHDNSYTYRNGKDASWSMARWNGIGEPENTNHLEILST